MKTKPLVLIILSQVILLAGVFVIVNVLQSDDDLTPEVTEALTKDNKVAVVGDSISIGPPTNPGFTSYYPAKLKSVYQISTSDSFAVGSAQTGSATGLYKGMRTQYNDHVAGRGYDAIIVMGGVNDINSGVSVQTVKDNLDWIYSQAKSAGMKVIAIPILPWGCYSQSSTTKIANTKDVNSWIRSNSKVDYFIDAYDEFKEGNDCLRSIYKADEVHPNATGHSKLAELINNKAFSGQDDDVPMQCGEVGCSANGDDAACGWPSSGVECKSGYNDGEGRCEIVCPTGQTQTGPCTCETITPTATATVTPTVSPTATSTPVPTTTVPTTTTAPTASPTASPTVTYTPTTTIAPTASPTATVTTVTETAITSTITNTPTSTSSIPSTALNSNQINTIVFGIISLLTGIYLKSMSKEKQKF